MMACAARCHVLRLGQDEDTRHRVLAGTLDDLYCLR